MKYPDILGLPDWIINDAEWTPQEQTMTEEIINSLPEFNTWLSSLKDNLEAQEIVDLAGIDTEELVDTLRYHLFKVYKEELQDETAD